MAVIGLNLVLITAGLSQIDVLPAYMKNFAGVNELGISLVFAANTLLIVLAQLPVARSQRGRRRMRTLGGGGRRSGASAGCSFPVVGPQLGSRRDRRVHASWPRCSASASACMEPSRRRS